MHVQLFLVPSQVCRYSSTNVTDYCDRGMLKPRYNLCKSCFKKCLQAPKSIYSKLLTQSLTAGVQYYNVYIWLSVAYILNGVSFSCIHKIIMCATFILTKQLYLLNDKSAKLQVKSKINKTVIN